MRTHITNLLGRGPNQTTAFLSDPEVETLAETLVAFANADGGTVLIGITPEGEVTGDVLGEDVEAVLFRSLGLCRPPVATEWGQEDLPQGTVVHINVSRSPALHSLADGRVLIRHGPENRPLGGDAIRQLAATKSSGDFEAEPVGGAVRSDLDDDIIEEYLEKRSERGRRPVSGTTDDHLSSIGALAPDGTPTVSGLLLFGKQPQEFLSQSSIVAPNRAAKMGWPAMADAPSWRGRSPACSKQRGTSSGKRYEWGRWWSASNARNSLSIPVSPYARRWSTPLPIGTTVFRVVASKSACSKIDWR
jgi:ATP-dependent DNA helicase RecG